MWSDPGAAQCVSLRWKPARRRANQVCIDGDYFFSTMPIRELIRAMDAPVPEDVREIADGLMYRDFITVGLLVDRLLLTEPDGSMIKDTWIYVQEPDVLVGRIQIFNNWSPHLVSDPSKVWIGLEYFCYDTDELWHKSNEEIAKFAIDEVARIGILRADEVRDSCVFRVPKTYPAYFGTYDRFDEIVRLHGALRESVPCRPQWHAQVQQPGPLDADGDAGGGEHPLRAKEQRQSMAGEHRAGIPRGKGQTSGEGGTCYRASTCASASAA